MVRCFHNEVLSRSESSSSVLISEGFSGDARYEQLVVRFFGFKRAFTTIKKYYELRSYWFVVFIMRVLNCPESSSSFVDIRGI